MVIVLLAGAGLSVGCDNGALKKAESQESILAMFSPPSPAEAVEAMVDPNDPDRRFRGTALIAYAPFGGEDVYVKYYVDAIKNDPDEGVRGVAARALGLHGSPEHAPLILPLLKSSDKTVRLEAVRALQRIHNPVAVEPLIGLTRTERFGGTKGTELVGTRVGEADSLIRAEACTALGQYAEPRVVQCLIDALDDDQLVITRAARDSLKVLTGQSFGEDQRAWLKWFSGNKDPFAQRGTYTYPVFYRDKTWIEYIPLVPPPPNEQPAPPVGLGAIAAQPSVTTPASK